MKKIGKLKLINLCKEELEANQMRVLKGGDTCSCCCSCQANCSCWPEPLAGEKDNISNSDSESNYSADSDVSRQLSTAGY